MSYPNPSLLSSHLTEFCMLCRIAVGDFNTHVYKANAALPGDFLNILQAFILKFPTYSLDTVILVIAPLDLSHLDFGAVGGCAA